MREFDSLFSSKENEQTTMIPLEEKLVSKFDISRFVVCTDAGLSSGDNRHFNDYDGEDGRRSFITTQSIRKLKAHLKEWALDPEGWLLCGDASGRVYDIRELDGEKDKDRIFFKSRWIKERSRVKENGAEKTVDIEQQMVVSYSVKYRDYQRAIRGSQIERARKAVANGTAAAGKKRQNDPRRFIRTDYATKDGEAADRSASYIDQRIIDAGEQFDGFYAVCTNLEDGPETIVRVNKRRWEIEECFRILKTDFEARPVYVKRQDRIRAHFITCFIALIVYRYLEKKLGGNIP